MKITLCKENVEKIIRDHVSAVIQKEFLANSTISVSEQYGDYNIIIESEVSDGSDS